MKLVKKLLLCLLALAAGAGLLSGGGEAPARGFEGKRLREDQIIAYRDKGLVEFYFRLPEDAEPVEIRVEVVMGDGGYAMTDLLPVRPGETLTLAPTRDGKGYTPFVPGIFRGRILVFGASGKVIDRVEPLECRIYESENDPYDAVAEFERAPREIDPKETEYRPELYRMRLSLSTYEFNAALYSLATEARDLDIFVYASVDGEERLISTLRDVGPNSICMFFYAEPSVADRMKEGEEYEARIEFFYSDTGELYEETRGLIETIR